MEQSTKFRDIDFLYDKQTFNDLGFSDEQLEAAMKRAGLTKEDISKKKAMKKDGWEEQNTEIKEYVGQGDYMNKDFKGAYEKTWFTKEPMYIIPNEHRSNINTLILTELVAIDKPWIKTLTRQVTVREAKKISTYDTVGTLSSRFDHLTLGEIKKLAAEEAEEKTKTIPALVAYKLTATDDLVFIQMGEKEGINHSLYMTVQDLVDGDLQAILSCTRKYHKDYYNMDSVHRNKSRDKYYTAFLYMLSNSKVATQFVKHMKNGNRKAK